MTVLDILASTEIHSLARGCAFSYSLSLSAITSISVSWIILFMTLLLCQPCLNYLSHGIFVSIGQYTSSCPPGTRGILAIDTKIP